MEKKQAMDGSRQRVFYSTGHTAVVYDADEHSQMLLQGHTQEISCMCSNEDHGMVITGDIGQNSLLVAWDTGNGAPHKVINSPHPNGCIAVAMTPDSTFFATLAAPFGEEGQQQISLWSVDQSTCEPLASSTIPLGDIQHCLQFNRDHPHEIMSNGKQRAYFWTYDLSKSSSFQFYSPPLNAKDFKQKVGEFTQSAFLLGTKPSAAVTGTVDGDLVVWEEQGIAAQPGTKATDRRAVKLLRIHNNVQIRYLGNLGEWLVSGAADGYVRVFDNRLRILAWFEDINAGEISSVSFANVIPTLPTVNTNEDLDKFVAPDFVVGTCTGTILSVCSASFDFRGRGPKVIVSGMITEVADVAVHPLRPEVYVLGKNASLQSWEFVNQRLERSLTMPGHEANALACSRDGSKLAIAFQKGFVRLLRTYDFSEECSFRNTRQNIVKIALSPSVKHMAVADDAHLVYLYSFVLVRTSERWEYIGRHHVHYGKVIDLVFGDSPAGKTRLFSLSQDGQIAEYDLEQSSVLNGLRVVNVDGIAQGFTPTGMCFGPPVSYYCPGFTETQLLIAHDGYKVQLYNVDTKRTCLTVVEPTYGGPITQLSTFQSIASEGYFLAYSTQERVAGLMAWPSEGDPNKTMALIAHPGKILKIQVAFDGRKVITASPTGNINVWEVDTTALKSSATVEGLKSQVLPELLQPEVMQECQEYFCYAQIRAQGEETTEPRNIPGHIPIDFVPDVLCALGYYPTHQEISNIMEELRFRSKLQGRIMPKVVDFDTLMTLFINHRPVKEHNRTDIEEAFKVLTTKRSEISKTRLLEMLTTEGEAMSMQEIEEALHLVSNTNVENLPSYIGPREFIEDLLGFEDVTA